MASRWMVRQAATASAAARSGSAVPVAAMACVRSAARWCAGFLPGDSALDRIAAVTDPALHKPDTMAALASGLERACPGGGVASAHASDQPAAEGLAAGW
jgi:hypothetical protein